MLNQTSTNLNPERLAHFEKHGYYFPVRVFEEKEAAELGARFLNYFNENWERIKDLPAREHQTVLIETHTVLNWVYRITSHPQILDAVESVLGPNLLVWSSGWIPKLPGDKKFVSWHQDATYWGLHPPHALTAWIAFTESVPENGCMRVIPDSNVGPLLPQTDTYARDNVLSRGQEIAVKVDEAKAVDLILKPGEMSLHHIGTVHGSKANQSDKPRIGLAIRYIATDVVQDGTVQQCATLVRGKDDYGNFHLIDPPADNVISAEDNARREEVQRRIRTNTMPSKS